MSMRFEFARCPEIHFGERSFERLGEIASGYGSMAVVVTGAGSLERSGRLDALLAMLDERAVRHTRVTVRGEPSPDVVDSAVAANRGKSVSVVVGVGGGSALDAGKAISAMLPVEGSVLEYLEEVGTPSAHSGAKVPFVAVPTTAGTGSEATKNAVLSRTGPQGFKVSLRHDNFVPDVAVVDPSLALSCPPSTTAACGMDAFPQLLESLVATGASPLTDALALSGLEYIRDNLLPACSTGAGGVEVRAGMAYAALLSGMALANAGLGVVHGLAAEIGGMFDVPHGVVCGTLVGAATRANISRLRESGDGGGALPKYAIAGATLTGRGGADKERLCDLLVEAIEVWVAELGIPRLGEYGVRESDLDRLAGSVSQKNNPVKLSNDEVRGILADRL